MGKNCEKISREVTGQEQKKDWAADENSSWQAAEKKNLNTRERESDSDNGRKGILRFFFRNKKNKRDVYETDAWDDRKDKDRCIGS